MPIIYWTCVDAHPSHYVVYRDGIELYSNNWSGNSISVSVNGLAVGVYNYTIIVYDVLLNWASDEVIVTILPAIITTTTTTTTTDTTTTTITTTSTTASPTETGTIETGRFPELLVGVTILSAIGLVVLVLYFVKLRKSS